MKFSKPGETETVESGGSDPSAAREPEMVELFGGEMTVKDAVTVVADVMEDPSGYGIATAERVEELEKENQQLEDKVEYLSQLLIDADSLSDIHGKSES